MAGKGQAVILFGAHRWGKQQVAQQLAATGFDIWLWMHPEEKVPEVDDPVCGFFQSLNYTGIAWQLNAQYHRWMCIPLDDFVCEYAAGLAAHSTVPLYPAKSAEVSFSKAQMRQLWDKVAANQPQLWKGFWALMKEDSLPAIPPGDYIVKPDAYAGSVGVMKVSAEELTDAITTVRQTMQLERERFTRDGMTISEDIIIEEAIPRMDMPGCAAEFTAHFISLNGQHQLLAVSEKSLGTASFIETGHRVPSPNFPAELLPLLTETCQSLLTRLEVQNSLSNWEFIITPKDQLALVEGQLRASGDHLPELLQAVLGVKEFVVLAEGALTGKNATIPAAKGVAGIQWMWPEKVLPQVTSVSLPELPNGWRWIIDEPALLQTPNWPGPVDWYNRHIAIMGVAEDAESLRKKMVELAGMVRLLGDEHSCGMSVDITEIV